MNVRQVEEGNKRGREEATRQEWREEEAALARSRLELLRIKTHGQGNITEGVCGRSGKRRLRSSQHETYELRGGEGRGLLSRPRCKNRGRLHGYCTRRFFLYAGSVRHRSAIHPSPPTESFLIARNSQKMTGGEGQLRASQREEEEGHYATTTTTERIPELRTSAIYAPNNKT